MFKFPIFSGFIDKLFRCNTILNKKGFTKRKILTIKFDLKVNKRRYLHFFKKKSSCLI